MNTYIKSTQHTISKKMNPDEYRLDNKFLEGKKAVLFSTTNQGVFYANQNSVKRFPVSQAPISVHKSNALSIATILSPYGEKLIQIPALLSLKGYVVKDIFDPNHYLKRSPKKMAVAKFDNEQVYAVSTKEGIALIDNVGNVIDFREAYLPMSVGSFHEKILVGLTREVVAYLPGKDTKNVGNTVHASNNFPLKIITLDDCVFIAGDKTLVELDSSFKKVGEYNLPNCHSAIKIAGKTYAANESIIRCVGKDGMSGSFSVPPIQGTKLSKISSLDDERMILMTANGNVYSADLDQIINYSQKESNFAQPTPDRMGFLKKEISFSKIKTGIDLPANDIFYDAEFMDL